jgi:hypothetical protein
MKNKIATPQISTLRVDIRIIQIGNKQMTINVFKQLYEKKCWDNKFNIIYPIWGKVYYKDFEYVIFQEGNELRKIRIPSIDLVKDSRFSSSDWIERQDIKVWWHYYYIIPDEQVEEMYPDRTEMIKKLRDSIQLFIAV